MNLAHAMKPERLIGAAVREISATGERGAAKGDGLSEFRAAMLDPDGAFAVAQHKLQNNVRANEQAATNAVAVVGALVLAGVGVTAWYENAKTRARALPRLDMSDPPWST